MKKVSSLVFVLAASITMLATEVTYTADNQTIFCNPERGFTEESSRIVSVSRPNVVKGDIGDKWGSNYKMRLMVVLYNFNKFKSVDLPQEILTGFDEDMQELRSHGLKCVLRFAYTETQKDDVDATPEWVTRHLEQLKPYLAKNADVIYVLEAGFVGVWGEWYYSANYGNETQHMNANRRKVIEALFANAPEDRFILFRYPMIKTEYLKDSKALTSEEGFSGTVKARMGCHNDAFLNSWGNDGTYASDNESDDPLVRQYIATETLYVPNGGETNVEGKSMAEKVYAQAPSEMSKYHWSFCGSSYAAAVTNRWHSSGIFDTLNVHMGYRYNMVDARFTDVAAPEGKANITIRIQNTGYAPLYNERPVVLVLKNQDSEYKIKMKADPRRWTPNYAISAINEQVNIPGDIPEGMYHLYLWLPDKYASLASDPRYAIRCANEGVWDEATGLNDLKADITISGTAAKDPGPLPEVVTTPEGIEVVTGDGVQVTGPKKVMDNGTIYIIMPDGRRYTMDGLMN